MSGIEQARSDVQLAKQIGFDAFALNIQNTVDPWSLNATQWLFDAAYENDFHLFFSFDMAVLTNISTFLPLLRTYAANESYYTHNDLPFVSTFNGATLNFGYDSPNAGWQAEFKQALADDGITPFFIPDFDDWGGSGYTADFFSSYDVVDGVLSWETAWPTTDTNSGNVSSAVDEGSQSAAHAVSKPYMMPLSTLQFKHITDSGNWYRRGELNLPQRMAQALALQPDFIEVITWNDAGESHYIGNVWSESISSSPDIKAYADGYDHSAWQDVIAPFITAYKNGLTDVSGITPFGDFAGAFWYRTILANASCSGDSMGKPSGWENALDAVNFAALLPEDTEATIKVYSGGNLVASFAGVAGLNAQSVPDIQLGAQKVELVSSDGTVLGAGSSTVDVAADTDSTCNFNYQVVHIA
ncbi:glycoside hydrolase [Phyllosticta capitalensis]|uniref:Glycoside hydrolase n=1 Tax=Phyllosticta capitalensis TaxID=121624 RepID=A0ABR1YN23_9PEZI